MGAWAVVKDSRGSSSPTHTRARAHTHTHTHTLHISVLAAWATAAIQVQPLCWLLFCTLGSYSPVHREPRGEGPSLVLLPWQIKREQRLPLPAPLGALRTSAGPWEMVPVWAGHQPQSCEPLTADLWPQLLRLTVGPGITSRE